MTLGTLARVAVLLPVLLLTPGTTAAATAADPAPSCAPDGVTVLVDFGGLAPDSGAPRTGCDDEVEQERAAQSIVDAGFELTYATRAPGFVCRVDGLPADDPCVHASPADAYWSLWWADADGEWVYAARGAATLRTPVGGGLALVWHTGAGEAAPPTVAPRELLGSGGPEPTSAPAAGATAAGLPVWVTPAVLGVLVAGAGVVTLRRRRA